MKMRYFTLSEANELLPYARETLRSLQDIQKEYRFKRNDLQAIEDEIAKIGASKPLEDEQFLIEGSMDFLQMEAQMIVKNLQAKGIMLRSVEMGLLDFPGVLNGEAIYWCWKMDEELITHYHGWHEGFSSRQLISDSLFDYNQ